MFTFYKDNKLYIWGFLCTKIEFQTSISLIIKIFNVRVMSDKVNQYLGRYSYA